MKVAWMRKTFRLLICSCMLTGILGACGKVDAESREAVQQEQQKEQQTEQVQPSTVETAKVEARIEGSFTVIVWDLLPDYVVDNVTLSCAVVSQFQCEPFIVYVGEQAAELEIGKHYTFTIENKSVGAVDAAEIGTELSYIQAYGRYGRVEIASFRNATEDECGLGGGNIQLQEDK